MRILYSGALGKWSTTNARRRALVALGHQVDDLDLNRFWGPSPTLLGKAERFLQVGLNAWAYNRALVRLTSDTRPDLIWLDTGAAVWPATVRRLRGSGARLLSYNSDYLGFRPIQWRNCLGAAALYDFHVTTNEFNAPILRKAGARTIILVDACYDPEFYRPPRLTREEQVRFESDAVFFGHCEPAYIEFLDALKQAGLRLRIWGPKWQETTAQKRLGDAIQIPHELWGEESVKAVAASKLGIGLFSQLNRNQSTGRSYEIPAIGQFFLAMRSADHLALYQDGKEAVFFRTPDELVAKAFHYLEHEDERKAIAWAGHLRCLNGRHTHRDRVEQILEAAFGIRAGSINAEAASRCA